MSKIKTNKWCLIAESGYLLRLIAIFPLLKHPSSEIEKVYHVNRQFKQILNRNKTTLEKSNFELFFVKIAWANTSFFKFYLI